MCMQMFVQMAPAPQHSLPPQQPALLPAPSSAPAPPPRPLLLMSSSDLSAGSSNGAVRRVITCVARGGTAPPPLQSSSSHTRAVAGAQQCDVAMMSCGVSIECSSSDSPSVVHPMDLCAHHVHIMFRCVTRRTCAVDFALRCRSSISWPMRCDTSRPRAVKLLLQIMEH